MYGQLNSIYGNTCIYIHVHVYLCLCTLYIYCMNAVSNFLFLSKGLDLHRPVIYQHSKKLLCSLTVLLACRDDYRAACEARLTQHEAFLHSPSLLSLTSNEGGGGDLQRCGSINSLNEGREGTSETSLARKARSLIKYISERYVHVHVYCDYMYIA